MSPTHAAEEPNRSPADSGGPPVVLPVITAVRLGVPSAPISMTWRAPLLDPPESPPGAPAATSGIPSRSRSAAEATDDPNSSPADSEGPPAVEPSMSAWVNGSAAAESDSAGESACAPSRTVPTRSAREGAEDSSLAASDSPARAESDSAAGWERSSDSDTRAVPPLTEMSLPYDRDPGRPGSGRSVSAPAPGDLAADMEPPPRCSAPAPAYPRSAEESPGRTT